MCDFYRTGHHPRDPSAPATGDPCTLVLKGPADGRAFPDGSAGDYIALTMKALAADPGAAAA